MDQLKGAVGRFLDLGAYDGRTFSNTLRLVELGWSGVCVEASPINFQKLMETHQGNDRVKLLLAPVSPDSPHMATWFDSGGDAVSTTDVAHKLKWEAGSKLRFREFYVYTMPLAEIFVRFGCDFSFINIDVESTNLQLFMALPWKLLPALRLICVEHDNHEHDMNALASAHGFHQIARNPENLILAR